MIFGKKLFLFFKNNFTRINHCKFINHKSHLKPFLIYLPWIVHREYFRIIFNVKSAHYTQSNTVSLIQFWLVVLTWAIRITVFSHLWHSLFQIKLVPFDGSIETFDIENSVSDDAQQGPMLYNFYDCRLRCRGDSSTPLWSLDKLWRSF
jgi:hypothetical protein